MKITKEQLKQIIKEELEEMMEGLPSYVDEKNPMQKTLWIAYAGPDSDTANNVARNFDAWDVDVMENFRNIILNHDQKFGIYITAVIDEIDKQSKDPWGRY